MRADLDTLVIALYCAACALFPSERTPRRGRPELISDNELLALMVAQMLLQCPSDRVFLRRARRRLGHLFPYLAGAAALQRALPGADAEAGAALEGDSLPRRSARATSCGCSTRRRFPAASRSRRPAAASSRPGPASATAQPTRAATGASNWCCSAPPTARSATSTSSPPTRASAGGSRCSSQPDRRRHDRLRQGLRRRRLRSRRPRAARAAARPSRSDEPNRPNPPIGWIRQRIESIVNSLKDQLQLEHHGGRTPAGLLARVTARILALCAAINLNQRLDLPSRELTAYAD